MWFIAHQGVRFGVWEMWRAIPTRHSALGAAEDTEVPTPKTRSLGPLNPGPPQMNPGSTSQSLSLLMWCCQHPGQALCGCQHQHIILSAPCISPCKPKSRPQQGWPAPHASESKACLPHFLISSFSQHFHSFLEAFPVYCLVTV
jgi:hypothetical protein